MKKFLISAAISLILFYILNIGFYYYMLFEHDFFYIESLSPYGIKRNISPFHVKLYKLSDLYKDTREYRPVMNPESKERPILIFGCSYAYGYIFDNTETISYIMSKYSKRPIINRGRNGWGLQHMLYSLKEDKKLFDNMKAPKYIFYVLAENKHHFERLYVTSYPSVTQNNYYYTYKNQNGNLVARKPFLNQYYNFPLINHIYNKNINNRTDDMFKKGSKELFDFFILHFKTINDLVKERWGDDTKIVVLTFEKTKKELWAPQLNEMGIDVVDIAETIGISGLGRAKLGFFEPEASPHPNGALWRLFVPKLKEMYPDL